MQHQFSHFFLAEVAAAVLDRDQEVGPIQDPQKSAGGCYQILILTQGLRKGGERK